MSFIVSNPSGDRNDKIANAAKVLGRSIIRKKVFNAIYFGKQKIKTVTDIMNLSGIKNKIRVLDAAKKLSNEDIIKQLKIKNETAYEKIGFYSNNKRPIIGLVENKERLNAFPTKVSPKLQTKTVSIPFQKSLLKAKQISIDDIDSFSNVKNVNSKMIEPLYENEIKEGLKCIIGETGQFKDWGGELNDLFSTTLKINGKRVNVAFCLKGKGTCGILIPKKMGKRSDQIQRLFKSASDVFLIQYCGQIDESILDQMKQFAISKSVVENKKIYYGIIDGGDTSRLITAYPNAFKNVNNHIARGGVLKPRKNSS